MNLQTIMELFEYNPQEFINRRFKSDNKFVVDRYKYQIPVNDDKFWLDPMFETIQSAHSDYHFNDIQKDDIVLDIGACIGGFTLPASRLSKKVYAVEPLFYHELSKNLELNHIKNVEVFDFGLGSKSFKLSFHNKTLFVAAMTLSEIIDLCGGHVDFLKMDCEGGEWCIKPEELDGIRRIEAEIHPNLNPITRDSTFQFEYLLKNAGFEYTIDHAFDNDVAKIIHARRIK